MATEKLRLLSAVSVTLLVGVSLVAGEPAATGAPKEPAPAAADLKKDDKNADKGAEKPFIFNPNGRRDPFVFALMPDIPNTAPIVAEGKDLGKGTITPGRMSAAVLKRMKEEAEAIYQSAEASFMDGNVLSTIHNCDKGIDVFKKTTDIGTYRELLEIRERLTDLRRAGERLKSREDAEAEFERIGVRLTGVVAREKHSQAIVNGKTVSKGDIVSANNESVDIVVDDIRPDQVIFLFRGYRVTQELGK